MQPIAKKQHAYFTTKMYTEIQNIQKLAKAVLNKKAIGFTCCHQAPLKISQRAIVVSKFRLTAPSPDIRCI